MNIGVGETIPWEGRKEKNKYLATNLGRDHSP